MKIKSKGMQTYELLRKELEDNVFLPGEKLPVTRGLAKRYGVSVNIVTDAVKKLVAEGYLEAKPRKGIIVRGENLKKKTEEELFLPKIVPGLAQKEISVWIEDSERWQKKFWQEIILCFHKENPDIKILTHFGFPNVRECNRYPDMIISGLSFLNHIPFDIKDFLDSSIIDKFYPNTYDNNQLFNSESFIWKDKKSFFPIGFVMPFIVCLQDNLSESFLNAKDYFDIINIVKYHAQDNRKKCCAQILDLWIIYNMLAISGCTLIDNEKYEFKIHDKSLWTETLRKIKYYYKQGIINFSLLDKKLSLDDICLKLRNREFMFKETDMQSVREFNISPCQTEKKNDSSSDFGTKKNSGVTAFPSPFDKYFPYDPINVEILKYTPFPEECLRILRYLLSESVQRKYMLGGLGLPVDKRVLSKSHFNYILKKILSAKLVLMNAPDKMIDTLVNKILGWEIYRYLEDMTDENVIWRTTKKSEYLKKNISLIEKTELQTFKTIGDNYETKQSKEFCVGVLQKM